MSAVAKLDGTTRRPIRVALADDSSIVRGLLSRWLSEMPDITVVGVHRDGIEAVRHVAEDRPDVLLLDIAMPGMDGLTALPLLLEASPKTRILIVSAASIRGADVTLRCLMRGASDYLTKPSGLRDALATDAFREALAGSIRMLGRAQGSSAAPRAAARSGPTVPGPVASPAMVREPVGAVAPNRLNVLVIGASTGGPYAVTRLLGGLRSSLANTVVVLAQHMPPVFTGLFAAHLGRQTGLPTREIEGGEPLLAGYVHVVRGGGHIALESRADGLFAVRAEGGANCRWTPSIDLLFRSAAATCGARATAVVLSGLGDDGAAGAKRIIARGGVVLVQDEPSSVAWGMPGATVRAGACTRIAPLDQLAETIIPCLKER